MSLHSYRVSQELSKHDRPFSAYIMAAMRKADTFNSRKLASAFPEIWRELQARYDAPGGLLEGESEQPVMPTDRNAAVRRRLSNDDVIVISGYAGKVFRAHCSACGWDSDMFSTETAAIAKADVHFFSVHNGNAEE